MTDRASPADALGRRKLIKTVAQPIPAADPIDPTLSEETGREAVLEAWHARPLDDRRAALARLIHEIVRSPGAAEDRRPYHAP